uniref:Uncharacterized protein n=1 Tax=Timema tahoe TaxID=61484 RepID=A0A7R9FM15_9NEOP|nr:unnamed protein product [Timema tahoe]
MPSLFVANNKSFSSAIDYFVSPEGCGSLELTGCRAENGTSPMASLVLSDSSQLTADGFENSPNGLTDHWVIPHGYEPQYPGLDGSPPIHILMIWCLSPCSPKNGQSNPLDSMVIGRGFNEEESSHKDAEISPNALEDDEPFLGFEVNENPMLDIGERQDQGTASTESDMLTQRGPGRPKLMRTGRRGRPTKIYQPAANRADQNLALNNDPPYSKDTGHSLTTSSQTMEHINVQNDSVGNQRDIQDLPATSTSLELEHVAVAVEDACGSTAPASSSHTGIYKALMTKIEEDSPKRCGGESHAQYSMATGSFVERGSRGSFFDDASGYNSSFSQKQFITKLSEWIPFLVDTIQSPHCIERMCFGSTLSPYLLNILLEGMLAISDPIQSREAAKLKQLAVMVLTQVIGLIQINFIVTGKVNLMGINIGPLKV